MLEYSRRERSRLLVERVKELEERLAKVRAAERERERIAANRASKVPVSVYRNSMLFHSLTYF